MLISRKLKRLVMLGFLLAASVSFSAAALAQDDGAALQAGTPPPDQGSEPGTGLLQISAVNCPGEAENVSILLAEEYVPPGECTDGYAAILIDGVDYGPVAPYLEISLATGVHDLTDATTGMSRDVEIGADVLTSVVVVVTFSAPVEPAEAAPTGITIVAHGCKPDIQSIDQLFGVGGTLDRLNACPAITLPGFAPAGTISAGEYYYDFALQPVTGEAQSLSGNGIPVGDFFCESAVGALDNNPVNDRCVDNSGFAFQVPDGSLSLTQTASPGLMRFVAAETGDPADGAVITSIDGPAGIVGLDTTLRSTEAPVVHLFFLNPPRVNVVDHLCELASQADFDALPGLVDQLLACPATARSFEGGVADFEIVVSDANWGSRGLDGSSFVNGVVCESDLFVDWNGDPGDEACLDAPTYRFEQTALGGVGVQQTAAPAGYQFAGAGTADAGVLAGVDSGTSFVSLDTSVDGDVTVHLFNIVVAAEPTSTATAVPSFTSTATATSTRTATATPTATRVPPTQTAIPPTATTEVDERIGTVNVAALYCLTNQTVTNIIALPPGQSASAEDFGGPSCFAGDAGIQLNLFGTSPLPELKLGRDGVEAIQGLPVTSGGGSHVLFETLSGVSQTFQIAPDQVTRVIIKFEVGQGVVDSGFETAGGSNGPGQTIGGLVTDDLISDEGMLLPGSFDGASFTSLIVDDLDAKQVSTVKDAKSLPDVGVRELPRAHRYLLLALGLAVMLLAIAASARFRWSAARVGRPGN